ncbi:MAG: hypothetical protein KIT84_36330 [Labilithrix sp.]|nr:hypothetical protein [Labilithrix sp.]MCW5816523.1 hypothetical protein [Labilithrix sp.]
MRRVALAVLAVVLGGCERGCLARWLAEQESSPEPAASTARGIDLTGTDCSDGLLRCRAGAVEASRVAHLPGSCVKGVNPEKTGAACVCPWDVVATCASGCADEEVEVTSSSDVVARQLCRPATPVARPVLGEDDASIDVCSDDGFTCRASIVRACDGAGMASRPLARCIHGCALDVAVEIAGDGPARNPAGVIAILCRRSDAERP